MSKTENHVLIMAGGVGSRFWPMSTVEMPKQFIDILGCGQSLIQLTASRFKDICPPENMWVVTSATYSHIVKEQLPEIPESNILEEPCRRNTAPCIAYASWKIKAKHPKANMIVTPSDHIIINTTEFQRVIRSAMSFTENSDAIVTLGMKPTRPETGYGYIEADLTISSTTNKEIYRVDSFKEKPDLETAKAYVKRNNYFWNSGIFIWNINTIINAFRVYQTGMSKIFDNLKPYYFTLQEQEKVNRDFPMCEDISVDYAILERAEEIFVMPADFDWSDLGTWGSLYNQIGKDQSQNVLIGNNIHTYETRNCLIHTTQEKKVVVIGLDGYIIAEKENSLLICKLTEEQKIKFFTNS